MTSYRHNHPGGAFTYRVESQGKVLVFCTDIEHGDGIDPNIVELAREADLLIHDAQYTPDELKHRKGWGHSSWEQAIEVARRAGVKRLALTHHDPDHDDAFLRGVEEECQRRYPTRCLPAKTWRSSSEGGITAGRASKRNDEPGPRRRGPGSGPTGLETGQGCGNVVARAAAAAEVVLVDVDDLDAVIDVVERDRVVRPVQLVVVDRALVVAVDELAGAGQRVDLAGVDLLADLLDQDPDVVPLGLVERRASRS